MCEGRAKSSPYPIPDGAAAVSGPVIHEGKPVKLNIALRRSALLAAVAGAATVAAALPASASVSPQTVTSSAWCAAQEFTQLQTGPDGLLHDYMYVNPTVNNTLCFFGVYDWSHNKWAYSSTSGRDEPYPGSYDGPGYTESVCVFTWSGVSWIDQACGTQN